MDIPEALERITELIEEIESGLSTAYDEADNANTYANSAENEANSAASYAYDCQQSIENANSQLEELKQVQLELEERIQEQLPDEDGERSAGGSELQRDIARYKVKVLHLKANGASVPLIAANLNIGEFLVSRILELQDKEAA